MIKRETEYWTVELFAGNFDIENSMWFGDKIDEGRYSNNLVFKTKEEALDMCNKLRKVLIDEATAKAYNKIQPKELPPEVINEKLNSD